jgi:hypothetical protein
MNGLNKDDVIRMAIDAIGGDMNGQDAQHLTWRLEHFKDDSYEFGPDALLKFVSLVAAAEREACAALCKGLAAWHSEIVTAAYENAADNIRARGNNAT